MGWPKKKRAAGDYQWAQDAVPVSQLAEKMGERRAASWKLEWTGWGGVPGEMLIVSSQSAEYAPKPAKVKKAKPAEPVN